MLVIHGEQDFRVPVSEALRLWTDLRRHGVPAKFLYFPDENHWILKPQNARIWYATVLAYLDEHLLEKPFERPRCCRSLCSAPRRRPSLGLGCPGVRSGSAAPGVAPARLPRRPLGLGCPRRRSVSGRRDRT